MIEIGLTTTNAGLTYNSTTSTFTATNINATSELRVGGNLISTTPSQWITSGANIYYSSGNVGIGTTTTFSLLHLHKNALAQNVRIILSDNTSTASASRGLHLIKDSTNISYLWNYENTALGFATNSTQRMTIADDGNVGIGTTNPFGILHLHKNALAGEVRVILSDNTSTASMTRGFQIIKGNDNNAYLANYENKASIFSTNSTERMRIAANGNVGIGTNNPTNKLHIVHSSTATNAEVGNISLYVYNPTNAANNNSIICTRIAGNSAGKALLSFDVENTGGWSIYTQGNNRALRINSNWQGDSNTDRIVISDDGSLSITGSLTVPVDRGMSSGDGKARYYYITNGASLYWGGGGDVMHEFRNMDNNTIFSIRSGGSCTATGSFVSSSFILSSAGEVYARGGSYDSVLYADSGQMALSFGNIGEREEGSYLKIAAASGRTLISSRSQRQIKFEITGGTYRSWEFNTDGTSWNGRSTSTWDIPCDQRIKENIVKADLKTCYDNVKNINLYRFNYIDIFKKDTTDKNKLGYIAQEVKKYFPKAINKNKERLGDKEIPDLLTINVDQINLTLYGAVKQLIKIVEKQNKRIKTLETLLNIEDNDEVENDAGEEYERIYDEEEVNIDDIEPSEPYSGV